MQLNQHRITQAVLSYRIDAIREAWNSLLIITNYTQSSNYPNDINGPLHVAHGHDCISPLTTPQLVATPSMIVTPPPPHRGAKTRAPSPAQLPSLFRAGLKFAECVGCCAVRDNGYPMAVEIEAPEEFGPAMLALDERRQRFVLNWLANGGKDGAEAARSAGYSDHLEAAKVQACRLLRQPKVIAALREEAERDLGLMRVMAQLQLKALLRSEDANAAQKAVDSVLDRTGLGRTTTQDVRVEHVDKRSTAELLEAIRGLLPAPVKAIEGEFEVVDARAAE